MTRFRNLYKCESCGSEWSDVWSCACNSKCPFCKAETTPVESVELDHPEREQMRQSLVDLLTRNASGAALFTLRLEDLADMILDWMEMNAEPVENLFNPDRDNGLQAIALKWTIEDDDDYSDT